MASKYPMNTADTLKIAWTTVETGEQARRLASALVEARLVACAQVSGPITSFFSWKGAVQSEPEYRITLKFPASRESEILEHLKTAHPYEVPQWLSLCADQTHTPYAQWVFDSTSPHE